jgi:hypothetical protein
MSEEQNTPIVEQNNEKNDNTKVEKHVENMVPQSRVNELTAKNHKLAERIEKMEAKAEANRQKKLEEDGELKVLLDETRKERDQFKVGHDEFESYKADRRSSLMAKVTNEDDIAIAESLPLDKLEKFVGRVTQSVKVGTPNQRPTNGTKSDVDMNTVWDLKDKERQSNWGAILKQFKNTKN